MWRWLCRGAPRRQPQPHRFRPEPAWAIAALERTQAKVEVCNQVKVDKGAPPAQAKFLDLPDDLSVSWWSAGRRNRKLLLRSCYDPIFNLVWEHNEVEAERLDAPIAGVVLLGNPGIGKTGFLWLALWKLLAKRRNIIIKLPTVDDYVFVTWKDGQLEVEERTEVPKTLPDGGEGVPWWYLADTFIPKRDWSFHCRFLLTCSPKKANYDEFAKAGNVCTLFDPIWTEDELLALNEHNFGHDPEDVRKRFLKWGGIPRYVLQKVGPEAQAQISEALGLVREFDRVINHQALSEGQSHKAFHMVVDESTFKSFRLAPASPYVEEQLMLNLPLPGLKRFLSVEQPDGIRDIQGKLLENFVCNIIIPRGGRMQYRELQQDGEFGPVLAGSYPQVPASYPLERRGGGGHEAVFPREIRSDHKAALFKPSSARNAEWNFIAHGGIYQVTVTKKRALVLGPAVEKALDFLRLYYGKEKQVDFYILVPGFNLTAFTIDWFDTIKPAERGKRRSCKDKKGMVDEVMDRIKQLNIRVKVVSLDIGDVCPTCMGAGIIVRNYQSDIISSLSSLRMSEM
ncbi:hypothetical protein SELMODRAFT_411083 [Selaginella moellendorffii]|uniref:Uncharacterized protein n=1 Tax=Selaginella moellendorffii TaxID=88036 RepID=D8RGJ0_SELML|nr:hypothetical protein SELMODRAFT_411083 [Selaginella moellendorffii]